MAAMALAGSVGCARAQPRDTALAAPPPAPAATPTPGVRGCPEDGPPQAGLPLDALTVETGRGPARFRLQVAGDEATREKGLMFVRRMADSEGMIFDFHAPQPVAFWMHNTYIPLDMLFLGPDGRVLSIAHRARPCDETSLPSGGPVVAVVEINGGLAERLGIKPGDKVADERIFGPR